MTKKSPEKLNLRQRSLRIEGLEERHLMTGLSAYFDFDGLLISLRSSVVGDFETGRVTAIQTNEGRAEFRRATDDAKHGTLSIEVPMELSSNLLEQQARRLGDIDGDGTVAFPDFLFLAQDFGTEIEPGTGADLNQDGEVAFSDFLIMSEHFGQTFDGDWTTVLNLEMPWTTDAETGLIQAVSEGMHWEWVHPHFDSPISWDLSLSWSISRIPYDAVFELESDEKASFRISTETTAAETASVDWAPLGLGHSEHTETRSDIANGYVALGTHGYFTSSGVDIHFVTAGEGPLVVMLHGFPDFWYTWRHQIPALAENHTVVAMDLRGYNQSGQPEGMEHYMIEQFVGDVRTAIEHFGHEQATIVGHDLGGTIAWWFAMLEPDMTERLVVLNMAHPNGFVRELANNPTQIQNSNYARYYAGNPEEAAAELSIPEMKRFYPSDALTRYDAAFQRSYFLGMLNLYRDVYPQEPYEPYDVSDKTIHDPVLVIHGTQDPYIHVDGLNGTEQWVGDDLTIVTLPQAGHWVHHDAADEVTKLMMDWLAD